MNFSKEHDAMRAIISVAVLILALIAAYAFWWRPSAQVEAKITEWPMLDSKDIPTVIATGTEGSVWFTIDFADAIGRVRGEKIERLKKPTGNLEPIGLAVANDGSAWFTDAQAKQVSHISADGKIDSITLEMPIAKLGQIAIAPDGSPWFAEGSAYSITRIKDGKLDRRVIESQRGGPFGVTVARDGTVWATLQAGNQILRIATDGAMKSFDIPTRNSSPSDIAVDGQGSVWFVQFRGNKLGKMSGEKFEEFSLGEQNAGPTGLAVARDGSVWMGLLREGKLARFKNGKFERIDLPRPNARPYSVAVDKEGNLWYTDISGFVGKIPAALVER